MNEQDLKALSAAARLSLTEEEKEGLLSDLNGLLSLFDTCTVLSDEPDAPLSDIPSATREDVPSVPSAREALLANAPSCRDGFFHIP